MTQLKASYSRRIRRPGPRELNPFPSFLRAERLHRQPESESRVHRRLRARADEDPVAGTVQLSPFYRRTSNVIRVNFNSTDTLEGREVTSLSFRNLASSNSWGADLNGQLRLGPHLNGLAGFNVFKVVVDGGSPSAVGSDAVTWTGRVNGTSDLTKTLMLQASYSYRAPLKVERGRFDAQQTANVALRMKIDGEKSSISLRVNDPFRRGVFRIALLTTRSCRSRERTLRAPSFWRSSTTTGVHRASGRCRRIRVGRLQDSRRPAPNGPLPNIDGTLCRRRRLM